MCAALSFCIFYKPLDLIQSSGFSHNMLVIAAKMPLKTILGFHRRSLSKIQQDFYSAELSRLELL